MTSCTGEHAKIGPLRVLSFKIECCSADAKVPTADKDPIVSIANIV